MRFLVENYPYDKISRTFYHGPLYVCCIIYLTYSRVILTTFYPTDWILTQNVTGNRMVPVLDIGITTPC